MTQFRNSRNVARGRGGAARSVCSYRPVLETLEERLSPAASLAAPTISNINAVSISSATVTWSPVANETGYRILLWNGTVGVAVATVGSHMTATTVGHLPAGQQVWL